MDTISPPFSSAPNPSPEHPQYTGRLGELYRLFFANLFLTIVTLGIYRFWAKTRTRLYLWSHIVVRGEPFEYTGTGKELFVGFLKAMLVLVPVFVVLGILEVYVETKAPELDGVIPAVRTILILWLIYVGGFAALRYRMSRTVWRGIRFRQAGSPWRYGTIGFLMLILSVVTLGLYSPFMNAWLQAYMMNNMTYGSAPFSFDGTGRGLFRRFFIAWLLLIPTLGLSLISYSAFKMSYYAQHTRIGNVSFAMPVRTWPLLRLIVGNLFLLLLSFGLLWPIVLGRTMRFWCSHLTLAGDLAFAAVGQAPLDARDREGLASALDTDISFG